MGLAHVRILFDGPIIHYQGFLGLSRTGIDGCHLGQDRSLMPGRLRRLISESNSISHFPHQEIERGQARFQKDRRRVALECAPILPDCSFGVLSEFRLVPEHKMVIGTGIGGRSRCGCRGGRMAGCAVRGAAPLRDDPAGHDKPRDDQKGPRPPVPSRSEEAFTHCATPAGGSFHDNSF